MYQLVYEKKNDVFTDSWVIAIETGNAHESVVSLIHKYSESFKQLGKLSTYLKSGINRNQFTCYELNEPQATFLITLLRNTEKVLAFKLALVKEFYRMRRALMERQTTDWLQTRKNGKLIRRNETDAIQQLIPYAEEQGSKSMCKQAYRIYSKLVNQIAGVESGQRDKATFRQLMTISMLEDMVQRTIEQEMKRDVYYKKIYQACKQKAEQFASLMYLDSAV